MLQHPKRESSNHSPVEFERGIMHPERLLKNSCAIWKVYPASFWEPLDFQSGSLVVCVCLFVWVLCCLIKALSINCNYTNFQRINHIFFSSSHCQIYSITIPDEIAIDIKTKKSKRNFEIQWAVINTGNGFGCTLLDRQQDCIGFHKVPSYIACMWMFNSVSVTAFLRKVYRYCGLGRDLDQILNSGVHQIWFWHSTDSVSEAVHKMKVSSKELHPIQRRFAIRYSNWVTYVSGFAVNCFRFIRYIDFFWKKKIQF